MPTTVSAITIGGGGSQRKPIKVLRPRGEKNREDSGYRCKQVTQHIAVRKRGGGKYNGKLKAH